ncbi:unnamed protein product [Darwinula stevensoni]|uniref:AIG1-type G domain-containing protein n=1 Tax=Darwinula stevensoni TaxID=69355 RepID=A0A7R9FRI1_9CRUS|nr:unnamed protein product [Darwinula stevensoni]CAG0901030.1 unnamed protein product [Darwinula stevensoni]
MDSWIFPKLDLAWKTALAAQAARDNKTICIIGVTGSGKSTLGNILLGRPRNDPTGFKTSAYSSSCTLEVESLDGRWLGNGDAIRVIDTPGHGDAWGRDQELRREMVSLLEMEGAVHAFIWVKNSQKPRFDLLELEHFDLLKDIFGVSFYINLIVVFSRWSFYARQERLRRDEGVTLEKAKESLHTSLVENFPWTRDRPVPMATVDACFAEDDPAEASAFRAETASLWRFIDRLAARPVESVQTRRFRDQQIEREKNRLRHRAEMARRQLMPGNTRRAEPDGRCKVL